MSDSPPRVLGIEGGGTKTEWVWLDEGGRELSGGSLPAANLRLIGDEALRRIFGLLPREATHAGVYLAGCGNEEDRRRLAALAREIWPAAAISVGSDRESGFAAAFGDGDGIAVIAGTGSAVTGRCAGRSDKAGGWGQLLGDKGSGYQLAVSALRFVLANYDISRTSDLLGQGILRTLALNRLEDLVNWAAQADKMSVAKLAPVVFEAAKAGHREMTATVQNGARILAEYTRAVAQRLECAAPEIALMGGLFEHHREYAEFFKDYMSELLPGASVAVCTRSGALGAAWLAGRVGLAPGDAPAPEAIDLAELAAAPTEQRNPRSGALETLATADLVSLFVSEEDEVARALRETRPALVAGVDLIAEALRAGHRLFYAGAGTSGRLGVLDASEIPPTFSAAPELVQGIIAGGVRALHSAVEGAEDQFEGGAESVTGRGVRAGDVVCGITASGRTPFVLGALRQARRLGARTMLLTCNPARTHGERWDVEIDLGTGPELVTGSTRLKAGTATKVALNILSTCAMVRLGKVRGNLMIDMNASNAKLRDRAIRQVCELSGLSYESARERLVRAGWSVRVALENAPAHAPAPSGGDARSPR